ncbi:MAG: hypothetical protein AAFY32_10790, partial [Pseudomonadota bacterium]
MKPEFSNGAKSFGTGFFIVHQGNTFLVTARHVVDDGLKPPNEQTRGSAIKIQIGCWSTGKDDGISFHEIEISNPVSIFCKNENDIAVCPIPKEIALELKKKRVLIHSSSIFATEEDLKKFYPGLTVFICGYSEGSPKLENATPIPFMRQCVLSTPLSIPISPPNMLGKDYAYLDGYALGGFSGSPVHMPQCGLPPGGSIAATPYWPQSIVGLVARRVITNEEK